ncbi:MAG: 50S ribosomal protein L10 [Anaerolineales bacterium]|nr:50S ribosomal protein L10 [Anaerolineales bacterium]
MAISKEQKQELVKQYGEWIDQSQALVLTKYIGLTVSQMEQLRRDIREAGGEFHIVKNTLAKRAFEKAGLEIETEHFLEDTAIGFAFDDAPGLAKAIVDFAEESDFIELKAGYLGDKRVSPQEIVALAKVPPLPVLRAQLLSTLMAPATKLSQILAEPGRQVAGVLKAYSDVTADAVPEAA